MTKLHSAAVHLCLCVVVSSTFGFAQDEPSVPPGIRLPRMVSHMLYANTSKSWHIYVLKMSEIMHCAASSQISLVNTLDLLCFLSYGLVVRTVQLEKFDNDIPEDQKELTVLMTWPLGTLKRSQNLVSYYLNAGKVGWSYDVLKGQWTEKHFNRWIQVCFKWHFSVHTSLRALLSFDKIIFSSYESTACRMGSVSIRSYPDEIFNGECIISASLTFLLQSEANTCTVCHSICYFRDIFLLWTVSIYEAPP